MRSVTVAAVQMQCSQDLWENLATAERLVRQAAGQGAQIILLPELFERPYFCQERQYDYYNYAKSVDENDAVQHFIPIAKELQVVLPISFYEKMETASTIPLRSLMRMVVFWEFTARLISLTIIIIRRSFTSRLEILDSRSGKHVTLRLALASAGTNGFQKQLAVWH